MATVCVGLTAPAPALADNSHGPKVDDRVALAAAAAPSTAPIPVIVFGKGISTKRDPQLAPKASVGGAIAGTVTPAQLDELAQNSNVAYIAPDVAMAPLATSTPTPTPTTFSALSTLHPQVDGAPTAWAKGYTGTGVGIAVVDSGISQVGNFGKPTRVAAKSGYERGEDDFGHGSFVADVAAGVSTDGRYVGIAPGATVVGYNVSNDTGGVYTSDVLAGLLWVLVNKDTYNIRVVNLSLAETTPSHASQSVLDTMVEVLWQSGIVVVTSSGNLGPDSAVFAPGNDPFAIGVGATDVNGTLDTADDVQTPWSTRGLTLDGVAKPELVAPGRHVVSMLPDWTVLGQQAPDANWVAGDYATMSGTSFSAPQVAGAAAVLLQEHPTWTPDQVKWVLVNTARTLSDGSAGLDLAAATAYAGTPPASNERYTYSQFGMPGWVDALLGGNPVGWKSNSWNSNSWNSNSWNSNSWNSNSWNSNSWNSNSWNSNSWNDHGWNG